ncbi:1-deoxy-D-xylulose 5-phosphate reductoisomerase [gamma proteobacterium HTCC5015]|nr:1-deoxy-D-xylulose 5-phosphate reductoisomerase [gamma proteobacterium HTCC5015]
MSQQVGVTVLGSTGTIGVNTLDVLSRHSRDYRVVALTAHRQVERMLEQCRAHKPLVVAMSDADAAERLRGAIVDESLDVEVRAGAEAVAELAALDEAQIVMAAIVGGAGLLPTLSAVKAGKRVLLANKEALVMSGQLMIDAVQASGATLLPIDSEHNAIFQCLPQPADCNAYTPSLQNYAELGVEQVLLTASGGPFRTRPLDSLSEITPEEAVKHPNWVMGQKISVDSATMMNKGLEMIEACWLFNLAAGDIQVVIHPESVIHSMVAYADGSVLAQMGQPDMRTPIANALAWPKRIDAGVEPLDLFKVASLNFEAPDFARFPCLELAYSAHQAGGTSTVILNAANEIAVEAFLNKRIAYTDIPRTIANTLERVVAVPADNLDTILEADSLARETATNEIKAF